MKLFNKRMRPNGQTSLFHTRADLNTVMKFCNELAEKVDELVESNNRLSNKIEKMERIKNDTDSP